MMENSAFHFPFLSSGGNPDGGKENLNGRRHDCDFLNISSGFGSQSLPKIKHNQMYRYDARGRSKCIEVQTQTHGPCTVVMSGFRTDE